LGHKGDDDDVRDGLQLTSIESSAYEAFPESMQPF